MVSIKTHNIIDYVAGLALILMPALAGFADIVAARNVFVLGGIALIAYSLCTKYEFAVWKKIPLGVHMTMDVALGLLTCVAPFLFDYRYLLTGTQEVIHYVLGLGVIGLVAVTRQKTSGASLSEDLRDVSDTDHFRRAG